MDKYKFNFRFWCFNSLPEVYDDSLSYYELLNKVVCYINHLIGDVANMGENVMTLYTAFKELEEFTNKTFSDILNDFADSINNGLLVDAILEKINVEQIKADVNTYIQNIMQLETDKLEQYIKDQNKVYEDKLNEFIENKSQDIENAIGIAGEVADQIMDINNAINAINTNIDGYKAEFDSKLKAMQVVNDKKISDLQNYIEEIERNLPTGNVAKEVGFTYDFMARANTVQNNHWNDDEVNNILGVDDSSGSNTMIQGNVINRREIGNKTLGIDFTYNTPNPDENTNGYWTSLLSEVPSDTDAVNLRLNVKMTYFKKKTKYVYLPKGASFYGQNSWTGGGNVGKPWIEIQKPSDTRIATNVPIKLDTLYENVLVNPKPSTFMFSICYLNNSGNYVGVYDEWVGNKFIPLKSYPQIGVAIRKIDNTPITPADMNDLPDVEIYEHEKVDSSVQNGEKPRLTNQLIGGKILYEGTPSTAWENGSIIDFYQPITAPFTLNFRIDYRPDYNGRINNIEALQNMSLTARLYTCKPEELPDDIPANVKNYITISLTRQDIGLLQELTTKNNLTIEELNNGSYGSVILSYLVSIVAGDDYKQDQDGYWTVTKQHFFQYTTIGDISIRNETNKSLSYNASAVDTSYSRSSATRLYSKNPNRLEFIGFELTERYLNEPFIVSGTTKKDINLISAFTYETEN